MERVLEADDGLPAGVGARDLDRVLDCFRAAVDEDRALVVRAGRDRVEALGQRDIRLVGHDGKADVREVIQLRVHGADHVRVAVAHIDHTDPTGEIDQVVAIGVGQDRAIGLDDRDRSGGGHTAGDRACAPGHQRIAGRTGHRGLQIDHSSHTLGASTVRRESYMMGPGTPARTCQPHEGPDPRTTALEPPLP